MGAYIVYASFRRLKRRVTNNALMLTLFLEVKVGRSDQKGLGRGVTMRLCEELNVMNTRAARDRQSLLRLRLLEIRRFFARYCIPQGLK